MPYKGDSYYIARNVVCPECGSLKGRDCVGTGSRVHASRVAKALKADPAEAWLAARGA